jgi:hypothetical protein
MRVGPRKFTIDLPSPILEDNRKIDALVISVPTQGAKRQAAAYARNGVNMEAEEKYRVALLARCCGVQDKTIEQVDCDIFNEAWSFVEPFLLHRPETPTNEL